MYVALEYYDLTLARKRMSILVVVGSLGTARNYHEKDMSLTLKSTRVFLSDDG